MRCCRLTVETAGIDWLPGPIIAKVASRLFFEVAVCS